MNEGRAEQTDVSLPSWKEVLSTPPPRVVPPEPPSPPEPEVRDRLLVHVVWEVLLAMAAAGLVLANITRASAEYLPFMLGTAASLGLAAAGLSLSLRTAAPNLAIGAIASATGAFAAYLAGDGWASWPAIALALGAALLTGVLLGLLAMLLSVPAWALSLGLVIALMGAVEALARGGTAAVRVGDLPYAGAFAVFAVVSVAGGAVWLIPGVRRALSGLRRETEPGRRAGLRTGLGALVGLAGSTLLAGGAGVVDVIRAGGAVPADVMVLPVMALAAVLIGGVSVFGRRGGVFGTLLGVVIVVSVRDLLAAHHVPGWAGFVCVGGMVVLGLLVSRAIEGVNALLDRDRTPKERQTVTRHAGKV